MLRIREGDAGHLRMRVESEGRLTVGVTVGSEPSNLGDIRHRFAVEMVPSMGILDNVFSPGGQEAMIAQNVRIAHNHPYSCRDNTAQDEERRRPADQGSATPREPDGHTGRPGRAITIAWH